MFHDLWMHSKGHRDNPARSRGQRVGIAVVVRSGQFYAVEDFAATVESLSFNQQEEAVTQLLSCTGLNVGPTDVTSTSGRPAWHARWTLDFPAATSRGTSCATARTGWIVCPIQLASRIQSGKYRQAVVGACRNTASGPFTAYNIAVLLYPLGPRLPLLLVQKRFPEKLRQLRIGPLSLRLRRQGYPEPSTHAARLIDLAFKDSAPLL